ncbi:hypothetical protein I6B53_03800 [Schaalia sp. 19OD2882]|uniref:hypothetical protein n=1 Tax=Schaalia sp. 19OD2882 TaxID=2794089 RepID=UPI001C1F1C6C|nr:hypothetical protein [Schaalia sp. 19OD2882]QWW20230.1 hypothetical protein I6B53_03800 [Schaalia sp. 19OD2882]
MTWDLTRFSVRCAWTRTGETPKRIAQMTEAYIADFSTRMGGGRWASLDGAWDGSIASLTALVRQGVETGETRDSNPAGGHGVWMRSVHSPVESLLNVFAGQAQLSPAVASPGMTHAFGTKSDVSAPVTWDAATRAAITAFDPAFVAAQERDLLRVAPGEGWQLPIAYRVWVNESVGRVQQVPDGVVLENVGKGTLVSVPVEWPAQRVLEQMSEVYRLNGLDSVPLLAQ